MKTNMLILKHQMHSARDLCIDFDIDVEAKQITLKVEWIDTQLLKWWIQFHQLSAINHYLKQQNKPELINLNGFKVKLIVEKVNSEGREAPLVDGKISFDVTLRESEINHEHNTLVMKVSE